MGGYNYKVSSRGWMWHIDWVGLAQDTNRWRALVNAMMNFSVSYKEDNFLSSLGHISFSERTLLHGVS
jgi:hypothetical protein